jgi:hypothetical protein
MAQENKKLILNICNINASSISVLVGKNEYCNPDIEIDKYTKRLSSPPSNSVQPGKSEVRYNEECFNNMMNESNVDESLSGKSINILKQLKLKIPNIEFINDNRYIQRYIFDHNRIRFNLKGMINGIGNIDDTKYLIFIKDRTSKNYFFPIVEYEKIQFQLYMWGSNVTNLLYIQFHDGGIKTEYLRYDKEYTMNIINLLYKPLYKIAENTKYNIEDVVSGILFNEDENDEGEHVSINADTLPMY